MSKAWLKVRSMQAAPQPLARQRPAQDLPRNLRGEVDPEIKTVLAESPRYMLCWADIEPGSSFKIVADTEVEVMNQAMDHVRDVLGLDQADDELHQKISDAIRQRIDNPTC